MSLHRPYMPFVLIGLSFVACGLIASFFGEGQVIQRSGYAYAFDRSFGLLMLGFGTLVLVMSIFTPKKK